jgi:hypothetical protein
VLTQVTEGGPTRQACPEFIEGLRQGPPFDLSVSPSADLKAVKRLDHVFHEPHKHLPIRICTHDNFFVPSFLNHSQHTNREFLDIFPALFKNSPH